MVYQCVCMCVVHCSVELRELETKLKAAYISKEHVTQMAEKAALKTEEKAMDLAAAHVMLEQCQREEEVEQQKELTKYIRMRKYHMEIKRQMEVRLTAGRQFMSACLHPYMTQLEAYIESSLVY